MTFIDLGVFSFLYAFTVQQLPESIDDATPATELLQRLQSQSHLSTLRVRRVSLRQAARVALHQAVAITYGFGPGHRGRGRWPPTGSRRHRHCFSDFVRRRRHRDDPIGFGAPTTTTTAAATSSIATAATTHAAATTTTAAATAHTTRLHFGGHRKTTPFHMGH